LAKTQGKKENGYMTETANPEGSGTRSLTSRRSFLTGSAAALAGGTLMAIPGVAMAHDASGPPSDIDILNYALTLERLEANFYRRVLDKFGEKEFEQANVFDGLGRYVRGNVYENFRIISDHENTHVKTLVTIIEKDLRGKAVPPSEYAFGITSVASALSTARKLENTGVSAYDGAIAHIQAAEYLTAGATIATVEARHASYLNLLNKKSPFPKAFDVPVAPRTICEAVQGFITSSPEPYGPYASLGAFCKSLPDTTS
jgi:hypothetical protein